MNRIYRFLHMLTHWHWHPVNGDEYLWCGWCGKCWKK